MGPTQECNGYRWADEYLKAAAERDAYREALAVIARDIADDGSVTREQVNAAYALARECAGVGK